MESNGGRCRLHLWRLWYVILICGLHGFLIFSSVTKYREFKSQACNPRYGGTWGSEALNFYLAMMILSLAAFPFFLYVGLLPVNNYANDGVLLGRDTDNLHLLRESRSYGSGLGEVSDTKRWWRRLKRHFLPYCHALHLLSAYCLLLPNPVLQAEQIRHGVHAKNRLWHSDLDFLFHPDTKHPSFIETTSEEILPLSPEFFSFLLALLCLVLRYPGTYWNTNKVFAFLFSIVILLLSLHLAVEYCAVSVLYKLAFNTAITESLVVSPQLSPVLLLLLPTLGTCALLVTLYAVFEYGYQIFIISLNKCGDSSGSMKLDYITKSFTGMLPSNSCLSGPYSPHLMALGGTIVAVCFKVPIVIDCIRVYRSAEGRDALLLANVFLSIIYLVFWSVLWLAICLKPAWKFEVTLPIPTVAAKLADPPLGDVNSPVYSTFTDDEMNGGPGRMRIGSNGTRSDCCSEDTDGSSRGGVNNYVFLRSDMLPLPNPSVPLGPQEVQRAASPGDQSGAPSEGSSYGSQGNAGQFPSASDYASIIADQNRPTTGVLKYAVTRGSCRTQLDSIDSLPEPFDEDTAGLSRQDSHNRRANRVTFKDNHDTIPDSPEGSNVTSSTTDSGIESRRPDDGISSPPANVPARQQEPTYYNQADFAALESNIYPDLPPPNFPTVASSVRSPFSSLPRHREDPPELVTPGGRSPFNSMQRRSKTGNYELAGALVKIPPPELPPPTDDRLCSQV